MTGCAIRVETNAGDLGADLDRAASAARNLDALDQRDGVAVRQNVAHGVTDFVAVVCGLVVGLAGCPLVRAHGAHQERALFVGVFAAAFGAWWKLLVFGHEHDSFRLATA